MNLGSDFLLGIFLLSIGVIFWVSIRLVVREFNPKKDLQTNPPLINSLNSVEANADAMIVVEPGGKLKGFYKYSDLPLFSISADLL